MYPLFYHFSLLHCHTLWAKPTWFSTKIFADAIFLLSLLPPLPHLATFAWSSQCSLLRTCLGMSFFYTMHCCGSPCLSDQRPSSPWPMRALAPPALPSLHPASAFLTHGSSPPSSALTVSSHARPLLELFSQIYWLASSIYSGLCPSATFTKMLCLATLHRIAPSPQHSAAGCLCIGCASVLQPSVGRKAGKRGFVCTEHVTMFSYYSPNNAV
jgi:hypothetical protein